MKKHKQGFYEKYIKRGLDFILSFVALIIFSPLLLALMVVGTIAMKGNPFFTQLRPGMNEKIFRLIKFRTMSNAKDKNGNLLPDEVRINRYGKFLRSTSLEGNDIIRQTTKSLENKGFREVSPILFFNGCNLISNDFRVMIA